MANVVSTTPFDWQDVFSGTEILGIDGDASSWQAAMDLLNHVSGETRHTWYAYPNGPTGAASTDPISVVTSGGYQVLAKWPAHVPEGVDEFTMIVRAKVASGSILVRLREDGSTTVGEVTISTATTSQGTATGSVTAGARTYSIEIDPDAAGEIEAIYVVTTAVSL